MAGEYLNELLSKIYTAFTGNAALLAAVSGGMWYQEAGQNTSMPYGVYSIITDVKDHWASNQDFEIVGIQFSYYSSSRTRTELTGIWEKHRAAYSEDVAIDGTYSTYWFIREAIRTYRDDESQAYRLDIDYMVKVIPYE